MTIDPALLERIVRLASAYEVADDLFFHVIAPDGYWAGEGNEIGDLCVTVNCNDLFYWACADAEPIETDADVDLLRECLQATDEYGTSLYACRRRKMRPQNRILAKLPDEVKGHFEACGPARTDKECG
jgi:hypothetical protein